MRRPSTARSEHRMLVEMPYVTCTLRAGSKVGVDRASRSREGVTGAPMSFALLAVVSVVVAVALVLLLYYLLRRWL
jgi:predicted secreted protein